LSINGRLRNGGDIHVSIKMFKTRPQLSLESFTVYYHQIMGREGATRIIVSFFSTCSGWVRKRNPENPAEYRRYGDGGEE
jgi:hypothetical protein